MPSCFKFERHLLGTSGALALSNTGTKIAIANHERTQIPTAPTFSLRGNPGGASLNQIQANPTPATKGIRANRVTEESAPFEVIRAQA